MISPVSIYTSNISRRTALQRTAGLAAMSVLPGSSAVLGRELPQPHFAPKAKQVIVLYMSGGYSHVDTFDPKPRLAAEHDTSIGYEFGRPNFDRYLKAANWQFRPNAKCGTEVSDLFPHIRQQMHECALIRSMNCDHIDHGEATLQLHTGSTGFAMPSLGSWLNYGLGTSNPSMPGHVVISEHRPYAGPQIWDSIFLPGKHAGVQITPGETPIPNLQPATSKTKQDLELELLSSLNKQHLTNRESDNSLKARISSFETAQGLQTEAPEIMDLSNETQATLDLYGATQENPTSYASQVIMARRMIESGVRFVEVIDAVGACRDNWDSAHRDIASHEKYAKRVDQPTAALIRDLKQRGLLDDVLIVFCTEFGRTPWAQDGKGTKSRAHHPHAFSCWLAGAGIKGGTVYGETDDIGNKVIHNAVHVHDYHATILHLMGLDHEKLTYRHAGRDFRLTDVHGRVVRDILS